MALIDKLTALADAFRASRVLTGKLTLDQMVVLASEISSGGGSSADVRYVTFMNGDQVLYRKPVAVGDDCVDVLTKGFIETPTKESDVQYDYVYAGWSLTKTGSVNTSALSSVTDDRIVYAAFNKTKIFYTINFYDGEALELTVQAGYGETVEPPALLKTGYKLIGWDSEVIEVNGNANYYAVWEEALARIADYSWSELSEISQSGNAKNMFMIGDTKTFEVNGVTLTAELIDFEREEPYDENKIAGMFFEIQEVYPTAVQYHDIESENISYNGTSLYKTTAAEIRNNMPDELRNALIKIHKRYDYKNNKFLTCVVDIFTFNKYDTNEVYSYVDRSNGLTLSDVVFEKYLGVDNAQKRIKLSAETKEPAEYWLTGQSSSKNAITGVTYWRNDIVNTDGTINHSQNYMGGKRQTYTCGAVFGFCI